MKTEIEDAAGAASATDDDDDMETREMTDLHRNLSQPSSQGSVR